ncbi:MAG: radical SAM protein [Desulfuromonadaceae bacterium]|nr:radical SAM protein [Desulfuromonadaceae bacterium]MDD2855772.1 radical SAM protein [Desulfuromonadaceae bacterium]
MEVILVQPRTSLTGSLVRMIPLGLLYAASSAVKSGHTIRILDCRIRPERWNSDLDSLISEATKVVGISVMSGFTILESLSISRYVKGKYPWVTVVWGGSHGTFSPDEVLDEKSVDFLVRGYGAKPFLKLLEFLEEPGRHGGPGEISGLSWRTEEESVVHNEVETGFEFIDYRDIPYFLIEDYSVYYHVDRKEMVFPMYSVMGCPHRCAFCSSPAQYAGFASRWVPLAPRDVVDHIRMVQEKFGATFIYFIDEDSFVDVSHVEAIIDLIVESGLKIKLGFRGARINEILGMSDEFLRKLVSVGTMNMHIGVESGSDRILSLMGKNVTVAQTIAANRKLAKHPELTPLYNFIVGYPTETPEETMMTRDLILQLIEENPNCVIIPLNKPRPLGGTALMELALQHGYVPPQALEEWGSYDVESSDYRPVWLTRQHDQFIRMMFLCMYFIDDKISKFSTDKGIKSRIVRMLAGIYKPVALFRFKYGIYRFLVEDVVYEWLKKLMI